MKLTSKRILILMALAGLSGQLARAATPPSPSVPPAQTGSPATAGATDLGLGSVADFPTEVTDGFKALLEGGRGGPGFDSFARPFLGALSARSAAGSLLEGRLKIPGVLGSLPIPEAFSMVLWVRLERDQKSSILFGFGDPEGDYLVATTDANGTPSLAFLNKHKASQVDRADAAAVNLADGRLHGVVAVVNLGSGLARLYVDGKPEAATTISMWRPQCLGFGFASYTLQGRISAPGVSKIGLLMPRLVTRELTEEEIGKIKPSQDPEVAGIDQELGLRLAKDTLVEFWPSQYSYDLRTRPLGN